MDGDDFGPEVEAECRRKLQQNLVDHTFCDEFCRTSYMECTIDHQSEALIFEAMSVELDKSLRAYEWGAANLPQYHLEIRSLKKSTGLRFDTYDDQFILQ